MIKLSRHFVIFCVLLQHDYRYSVFSAQREYINKHNIEAAFGLHSYDLGINQFSDLTHDEFLALYTMKSTQYEDSIEIDTVDVKDLPAKVDWRDHGLVTPIKAQGNCGSCWAFAAVGAIEGAHAKATGKLESLSEEQLVQCDSFDYGCHGGLPVRAFKHVIKFKGIMPEKAFPYPVDHPYYFHPHCKFNKDNITATISSYKTIPSGNEAELQKAVAEVGPVSVSINAALKSFQSYRSGVFNPDQCPTRLDHSVVVVGYGQENGLDYWLIKNSWDTWWGLDGYGKMVRNKGNKCGIATSAVYPIV